MSRPLARRFLAAAFAAAALAFAAPPAAAQASAPPPAGPSRGWYRPPAEFDSLRYVVVTARALVPAWKPLARWKTQTGVSADVVAVEDVLDNPLYRGTDGAETLRNFLADLYWKWGLEWVLLGGDVNLVPARMVPTMEGETQAADLYFGALDGSWNSNCDASFGDGQDRTDLVEELYVGRVPAETREEVEVFLKKFFLYVKPKHRDYQTRVLLVGAVLGSDANWDADDHYKEIKDDAFVPAGFEVTELEESTHLRGAMENWKDEKGQPFDSGYVFGEPNKRTAPCDFDHFKKYMDRGTGIVSHIIHSNVYLMGLGHGWITRDHVRQLANEERPGVIYSSGCEVNMFNMEPISEHMM
ncbi:MAG: C25 family cysteine peptidase, partial [Planctomycetes bacterium]|nr:C25 family cysteine peptidase [Planctomycetota bacterium]